jgi:hypothetical protein
MSRMRTPGPDSADNDDFIDTESLGSGGRDNADDDDFNHRRPTRVIYAICVGPSRDLWVLGG